MEHATVTRRPPLETRRPPLETRPRRAGPRRAAAAVAASLVLALAACEPGPAGGEGATDGLLILAKSASPTLDVLVARGDSGGAVAVEIPLPGTNVNWISAGGGGTLAATMADGRLFSSDPVDPGGPAAELAGLAWRPADETQGSGRTFEGPGWFATWDPAGRAFAALAGDLLGRGDMRLVVVDPASSAPVEIALGRPLLPAPPAWLDDDRVAVVAGTTSAPETVVVDVSTGGSSMGPPGERRFATSSAGSLVATSGGAGTPITIRSTAAWLAVDGTSVGAIEVPDGFSDAISLALDTEGSRLAVVWLSADGALRYDIHDGADGWRRVWTADLGDATAAAVAWLR